MAQPNTLDSRQVELIKKHLNMVFLHEIDPSFPEKQQEKLNKAHTIDKDEISSLSDLIKNSPVFPPPNYGPRPGGAALRC